MVAVHEPRIWGASVQQSCRQHAFEVEVHCEVKFACYFGTSSCEPGEICRTLKVWHGNQQARAICDVDDGQIWNHLMCVRLIIGIVAVWAHYACYAFWSGV